MRCRCNINIDMAFTSRRSRTARPKSKCQKAALLLLKSVGMRWQNVIIFYINWMVGTVVSRRWTWYRWMWWWVIHHKWLRRGGMYGAAVDRSTILKWSKKEREKMAIEYLNYFYIDHWRPFPMWIRSCRRKELVSATQCCMLRTKIETLRSISNFIQHLLR